MTSAALDEELNQTPDLERLKNVKATLAIAKIKVVYSPFIEERSAELQKLGFTSFDAAHLASAERGKANIFLSTDDRLIRKAQKNIKIINVAVNNPVNWLMESTQTEENDND
ncbi:MAG: hypothetical protein MH252_14855 [Thermosynechococcaceae cyanobacterium MS004]|nr:hypothetical protein [Thermosynechococcaceae cyanobacterium MS004]